MAVLLTGALIAGAAMAAAGTAAAIKGLRTTGVSPDFTPYQYGGSRFAANDYRTAYGKATEAGSNLADLGVGGYAPLIDSGAAQQASGDRTLATALDPTFRQGGVDNFFDYDPARLATLQSEQAMAAAARRTNAVARTGGALGMRAAINANANTGTVAARDAAIVAAQAEQQRMGAAMQNQQMINATRMGLAGIGQQQQQFGAGLQAAGAAAATNLGLSRETLYSQQLADFEKTQLEAQMQYEQARQQARLDKRRLIVGLGAGLISGGGNMMASSMGGGGGAAAGAAKGGK